MIIIEETYSDALKEALKTIDELADMIIFHAEVRENAEIMSSTAFEI